MSLKEDIRQAFSALSQKNNFPHLRFNKNDQCVLQYNDDFNIEVVLYNEGIQLRAYLLDVSSCVHSLSVIKTLLAWNNSECSLQGSFLGVCDVNGYITFTLFVHMESISHSVLENIIDHFINESVSMKDKISSLMKRDGETNNIIDGDDLLRHMNMNMKF